MAGMRRKCKDPAIQPFSVHCAVSRAVRLCGDIDDAASNAVDTYERTVSRMSLASATSELTAARRLADGAIRNARNAARRAREVDADYRDIERSLAEIR